MGSRGWLLILVLLACAWVGGGQNRTVSHCTDAKNCFLCFKQQECVEDKEGNQLCKPCGWCTDEYDETNWDADTYGDCVVATPDMALCNSRVSAESQGYCPDTVCDKDKKKCACVDNVCPPIDLLLGLFSMEGFWLLVLFIAMFGMGVMSACMLNACFRPAPREVIVYRDDARASAEEEYVRMD
uniref:PSI domain-containing protein n=2 Tax=Hemiselmis andersenii TaxID=464988 RepID=A0A6U4LGX3_HEMAN